MSTSGSISDAGTPLEPEEAGYPYAFGPYALLCALGRGGMGAVHLAKQGSVAGIEKYCVVKTLRQKHVDNEEYISRFMDEARLVVHLAHRNICPIFDVGRVGQKHYLAMELIEGRDLNTLVDSCWAAGRVIPPAVALHLACEVLEALDYAHRRTHPVTGEPLHIVHRDVSPHNVMVNFEGEVKLIDFGLAASSLKVERTDPKIVLGKLSYMSREHLRAQPVDGRHDLFGVAVMLYEMLAGERYYADVASDQILPLLADGEHVPRRLASFDPELREILTRALSSDARQRPATCGELRDQVQQYMLRRQLGASTRELRALMDELFPGQHTSVSALLQRFQNVKAPSRDQDQSTVIARAGGAATMSTMSLSAPSPRPVSQRPSAVYEPQHDGDMLDFGEIDAIGDASGDSSSQPNAAHWTPNPITEPTGRVEVPAALMLPATVDHSRAGDATVVLPRAAQAQRAAKRERHVAAWAAAAAAIVLLAAAGLAWLWLAEPAADAALASLAPAPAIVLPSSLQADSAKPASSTALASDLGKATAEPGAADSAAAPVDDSAEPAGHEADPQAADVADDPAPEASASVVSEALSSAAAKSKALKTQKRKPLRRAVARRAAPAAKEPALKKNATPEEKVRYLDSHCQRLTCARTLVARSRAVGLSGMTTDEVRAFWPRVNSCLQSCSE